MTDSSNVTEAMIEAYRLARDEAAEWCGCYDGDENRHYIVKGNEILWEKISETYGAGHAAMKSELRRLRDAHALSAALAHPGQVRGIAIKPLEWKDAKDRGYSQADCALGQYQVGWLGEFECWQCFRPHRSGLDWKDNFSRHASKDEAKAAAQADYDQRIRSALALPLPVQEPVAWRVRDFADGWIYGEDEPKIYVEETGALCQPLYLYPFPSIPEEKGGTAEKWRSIDTAPKDKTAIIIAVPTKDHDDFIVGEAYFDPENYDGGDWWWAGTSHDEWADGPIGEVNHNGPTHWMPLPASTTEGQTVKEGETDAN